MSTRVFIDTRLATRNDLKPRTWLYHTTDQVNYVARINDDGDWTAYQGFPSWTPIKVSVSGHRLSEEKAREIFPMCKHLPYRNTLKIVPFKPKQRPSVRAVLNSFEEALIEAGFAEIEDLRIHRFRAGLAVVDALELAQSIRNGSVDDLSENFNLLVERLEEAMYSLRPRGEDTTPTESKEVAS